MVRIGPVSVDTEVTLAIRAESVRKPSNLLVLEVIAVRIPEVPVLVGAGGGDTLPDVSIAVASAVAAILASAPWVLRDHHRLTGDQFLEGSDIAGDRVPFIGGVQAVAVIRHYYINWVSD